MVDKATEDYYRKLDIIVSKDLPNVERLSSVMTAAVTVPDSAPPPIPEVEIGTDPLGQKAKQITLVRKCNLL